MANYPPKVLKNPTENVVEFMCGGRIYIYQPGEERPEEGFVAYHALNFVNTGLVEVDETESAAKVVGSQGNFKEMSWQELLKEARRFVWFKVGMNRQQIVESLENERPREKTKEVRTAPSPKKAKGS